MNEVTALLLGLVLLLVGLYDIWLSFRGESQTISSLVQHWSRLYPALPFAAGALVAHLFGF